MSKWQTPSNSHRTQKMPPSTPPSTPPPITSPLLMSNNDTKKIVDLHATQVSFPHELVLLILQQTEASTEELDLSENGLDDNSFTESTIAQHISQGNMSSLRILKLQLNKLQSLPTPFHLLTNLHEVNLSNNELKSIPIVMLQKLPNLRVLDLSHNAIELIPSEISCLQELREFRIDHNELITLPPEISTVLKLEQLFLHKNKLETIPKGTIGNLPSLRTLWIHSNKLTELPLDFGNLSHLTTLLLFKNPLKFPPMEVCFKSIQSLMDFLHDEVKKPSSRSSLSLALSHPSSSHGAEQNPVNIGPSNVINNEKHRANSVPSSTFWSRVRSISISKDKDRDGSQSPRSPRVNPDQASPSINPLPSPRLSSPPASPLNSPVLVRKVRSKSNLFSFSPSTRARSNTLNSLESSPNTSPASSNSSSPSGSPVPSSPLRRFVKIERVFSNLKNSATNTETSPPTNTTSQEDILGLKALLIGAVDPEETERFLKYLEARFCSENFHFWNAVQKFRSMLAWTTINLDPTEDEEIESDNDDDGIIIGEDNMTTTTTTLPTIAKSDNEDNNNNNDHTPTSPKAADSMVIDAQLEIQLVNTAMKIYREFLRSDAQNEVNISAAIRNKIEEILVRLDLEDEDGKIKPRRKSLQSPLTSPFVARALKTEMSDNSLTASKPNLTQSGGMLAKNATSAEGRQLDGFLELGSLLAAAQREAYDLLSESFYSYCNYIMQSQSQSQNQQASR